MPLFLTFVSSPLGLVALSLLDSLLPCLCPSGSYIGPVCCSEVLRGPALSFLARVFHAPGVTFCSCHCALTASLYHRATSCPHPRALPRLPSTPRYSSILPPPTFYCHTLMPSHTTDNSTCTKTPIQAHHVQKCLIYLVAQNMFSRNHAQLLGSGKVRLNTSNRIFSFCRRITNVS